MSAFAEPVCKNERQTFKGEHTRVQEFDSFQEEHQAETAYAQIAFINAARKARAKGFVCNPAYAWLVETGLFNSNKRTAVAIATCFKRVCDE